MCGVGGGRGGGEAGGGAGSAATWGQIGPAKTHKEEHNKQDGVSKNNGHQSRVPGCVCPSQHVADDSRDLEAVVQQGAAAE